MKNRLIAEITRKMLPCLDNAQMEQLQDVLQHCLWGIQITENPDAAVQQEKESNVDLLNMFLSAKRVEGCSDKTLHYYENSIRRLFAAVDCHVTHKITYFEPDKKKAGGAYVTVTGTVKRIDEYEHLVIMTDGKKINIDDIYNLQSELFYSLGLEE